MIDVSDDVYSSLVEPHKKNKTFSKLIVSLLTGYLSDGYIRAFVDDNLEDVRRAVVGSFEDSVGEMETVLASMGLYTDALGAQSSAGYAKFQQSREKQAEELDNTDNVGGKASPKSSEEVAELREKVDVLERTVTDGFNRILEILSNPQSAPAPVVSGGASSVQSVASGIIANKALEISDPKPLAPTTPSKVPKAVSSGEGGAPVDSSVAESFLTSIMSDFGSF